MSEEEQQSAMTEETGEDSTSQNDQSVPYDRFKQVNDAKKAAEEAKQQMEERLQAIERQQKEEKEEYKSLYEQEQAEREAAEAKAKEWEQYQASRREALLSQLPDDATAIAEGISDLDKLEQFVQRETSDKKGTKSNVKAGMIKTMEDRGITKLADAKSAQLRGEITEDEFNAFKREKLQQARAR